MIGLVGRGDDPCIDRVREAARERGIGHVVIDEDRLAGAVLRIDVGEDGVRAVLRGDFGVVDLDRLTGVYARPLGPVAPEQGGAGEVARLLHEWLDVTRVPCLGRPRAMWSNSSKPFQAQSVVRHGLATPATLVTNDPALVRDFRDRHGRVVYKSVSGIRSIVRELDEDALARLDRVRDLPTQFQAYVGGDDVRVHVVGERVFPTRIVTTALDYRYAARDGHETSFEVVELEPDVERACVALAADLELPLAGIDLRMDGSGPATCFEVNPMPAFSWFEAEAGLPIAAAIADFLDPSGTTRRTEDNGGVERRVA